tara:strand:+ start:590 stop:1015 length:426 start_codon:yes stop_codon:yes gene_type:complete
LESSKSKLFLKYPIVDLKEHPRIINQTIQNTIKKHPQMAKLNETESLKKLEELKQKLKLKYKKDEIYIVWLFGRSYNLLKRDYLSPINKKDHNTLSEIPGFVLTKFETTQLGQSEGKPLLTFVSDEVSVDKFEEILSEINK